MNNRYRYITIWPWELNDLRLADRKVRVGGKIIYTPDKDDDLDDSDPDDDLNLWCLAQ